ncbi:hypothetical protein KY309_03840 [Candidatus Woesearchaeota archaeon]|nr:hypothetical protein [Candidatus Woesearchaeota archaeon]MBW3016714.1 hypothetical protein [Candidatus Woesearchaeota archaeon]
MKYSLLLTVFFLGLLIGLTAITELKTTGQATRCYAENQLCECEEDCKCGNITIPLDYCLKNVGSAEPSSIPVK